MKNVIVLAHPDGRAVYLNSSGSPKGLAKKLLDRGQAVLLLDTFLTGELADADLLKARKPFANYFTTYNRTDAQERVQDLVTACAFAQTHSKGRRVVLCGTGRAGLWSLLAAPAANAVVADCDKLDLSTDDALLAQDLFLPGIRKIGAFEGAAALAAPNPLMVHNTGKNFSTDYLRETYEGVQAMKAFRAETVPQNDDEVVKWIAGL